MGKRFYFSSPLFLLLLLLPKEKRERKVKNKLTLQEKEERGKEKTPTPSPTPFSPTRGRRKREKCCFLQDHFWMTKRTLFFSNNVLENTIFYCLLLDRERKKIFAPKRKNEFASKYSKDLV